MFLLVECLEAPREGCVVIKDVGIWGRYEFRPQEAFEGRCVVEVASEAHQQKLLEAGNGAGGRPAFGIPHDLQVRAFRLAVRKVVEEMERGRTYSVEPRSPMATQGTVKVSGLLHRPDNVAEQAGPAQPSAEVQHRGPGRPRKP